MTVTGACRTAASFMAHSSAYAEWADPSMPTVIPGIFCLLLLRLPLRAARTLLPLSFRRDAGTRDFRARQWTVEPDQDRMSSTRRLGEPTPVAVPGRRPPGTKAARAGTFAPATP